MISQSENKDKRNELLEAALQLFVELGFHGTPTSKIAERAGVANGTLFHYFKTKDELVIALYIDVKEKMSAHLYEAASKETTLKGKFRSLFVHSLLWALANKTSFQFIQQFHTSPFLSKISPAEIQKQAQAHFALTQAGIDARILKPLRADYIYTLVMGQVFGLFQYLINGDFNEETRYKIINDTFDLLWVMLT